jgi:SAM-dependent methyltransferase
MTQALIQEYYTSTVRQEWRRLVRSPFARLELDTTLYFLEKHLPAQGLLLDAGGGPGRYTVELARRGYDVVLLDMTPANVEFARRQVKRAKLQDRVPAVLEGSILDLSRFADNTFDAVLCLGGPLSHVLDKGDRRQAVAELIRVAKPGAPLFVSVMGRLSLLAFILLAFQPEIEMPHFVQIRDTGTYLGGTGFTACHFFMPEELKEAFEGMGVTVEILAGLEGLNSRHEREVNRLAKNERRWATWLETHLQTCTHPAVVSMSEHMLIVCRKL